MSQRKIIMGIDTSNYTTSCALMYSDGELIANLKIPLPVKEGEVGLRQSEAVFSHIKNLPEIMKKAKEVLCGKPISAIGVSTRPRNIDGSYMPCFLCGKAAAHSVSAAMGIPVCEFNTDKFVAFFKKDSFFTFDVNSCILSKRCFLDYALLCRKYEVMIFCKFRII